jgi:hypothetical protein
MRMAHRQRPAVLTALLLTLVFATAHLCILAADVVDRWAEPAPSAPWHASVDHAQDCTGGAHAALDSAPCSATGLTAAWCSVVAPATEGFLSTGSATADPVLGATPGRFASRPLFLRHRSLLI